MFEKKPEIIWDDFASDPFTFEPESRKGEMITKKSTPSKSAVFENDFNIFQIISILNWEEFIAKIRYDEEVQSKKTLNLVLRLEGEELTAKPFYAHIEERREEFEGQIGDMIGVNGKFDAQTQSTWINSKRNITQSVIIEPRIRITPTMIIKSYTCPRSASISIKVRRTAELSESGIIGTIKHDIFEFLVSRKKFTDPNDTHTAMVRSHVFKRIQEIIWMELDEEEIIKAIDTPLVISQLCEWVNEYIVKMSPISGPKATITLTGLVEAEGTIVAPFLGLSGKFDLLFKGKVCLKGEKTEEEEMIPLEFKSGKDYEMNDGQSLLYGLMLQSQKMSKTGVSIMFNLQTKQTRVLMPTPNEAYGLIKKRNFLAKKIKTLEETGEFPSQLPKGKRRVCGSCFQKHSCLLIKCSQSESFSHKKITQWLMGSDASRSPDGFSNDNFKPNKENQKPNSMRRESSLADIEDWVEDGLVFEGSLDFLKDLPFSYGEYLAYWFDLINEEERFESSKPLKSEAPVEMTVELVDPVQMYEMLEELHQEKLERNLVHNQRHHDISFEKVFFNKKQAMDFLDSLSTDDKTILYQKESKSKLAGVIVKKTFAKKAKQTYKCEIRLRFYLDDLSFQVGDLLSVLNRNKMKEKLGKLGNSEGKAIVLEESKRPSENEKNGVKENMQVGTSNGTPSTNAEGKPSNSMIIQEPSGYVDPFGADDFDSFGFNQAFEVDNPNPQENNSSSIASFQMESLPKREPVPTKTQENEKNEEIEMIGVNFPLKWVIETSSFKHFTRNRGAILDLITNPRFSHLAKVIIGEGEPPSYCSGSFYGEKIAMSHPDLNEDQKGALDLALRAKNYHLIQGLPGTGKTYTICILLKMLLASGNRILLSCFTHNAIDLILTRLLSLDPDLKPLILRIAPSRNSVAAEIQDCIGFPTEFKYKKDFVSFIECKRLVAATCSSSRNKTLQQFKSLDYVVIDEASQVTEPTIIESLSYGKRFIMIGDYRQLSPLVKSPLAAEKGLKISLFERLCKRNKSFVSYLATQYRMNETIMMLSNSLVYENCLKIAEEYMRERTLVIPNPSVILRHKWLGEIIDPNSPVKLVNMDGLIGIDHPHLTHSSEFTLEKENFTVCDLGIFIASRMIQASIRPESIAVITPYNLERSYIQSKLTKRGSIDILTIDRSQGIDKDCIIIILPRRVKQSQMLLENWQRLNVAFTRAKVKIIVIGFLQQLRRISVVQKFIEEILNRCWVALTSF